MSRNALDVVVVHKGYRSLKYDGDTTNNVCSCNQQIIPKQSMTEPRKRHNATQTPTSLTNVKRRSRKDESRKTISICGKHCTCLTTAKRRDCSNCSEVHHCQYNSRPTSYCCCSATRHSRFYSRYREATVEPRNKTDAMKELVLCGKGRSFKRNKRCSSGCHNRLQHMYHPHKTHCISCNPACNLPNTCTKSSLESSDDQNRRLSSTAMQEIAIEIDAATMTEDNSTTATSNFAFKAAADSALAPIIRAPVHIDSDDGGRGTRLRRKTSMNSNTTIETDELSNEDVIDKEMDSRCYCHCCDHGHMDYGLAAGSIQNECVKIKRKRFISAEDYCSSCSTRCSSCSCSHANSSSCSSFEEWPLEGRHSVRSASHGSHAFMVSADCHHCLPQRQNSETSAEELEGRQHASHGVTEEEVPPEHSVPETTDSSAHTSRRSSVSISFCSCNSNNCCYCAGSYEDSYTGHMCTARDASIPSLALSKLGPIEGEEGHSSTLTPLTNPSSAVSTPGDEGDVTVRSFSNAFSEDTSSQSHSAEYFSLSSSNHTTQETPRKQPMNKKDSSTSSRCTIPGDGVPNVTVIDTTINTVKNQVDDSNGHKGRKPCKHYSKHHRHKRDDSPVDSYL